jgi:outer membrane lipoprotein-sorting protein
MNVSKHCVIFVLSGLVLLTLAAAGRAYILPAEQILEFMIKHLGPLATLQISQKTVIYDPSVEEGAREFDATLYYQYPDRFRYEVTTPEGQEIRVVGPDGAVAVQKGKIVSQRETRLDHFKDPLLCRNAELLHWKLSQGEVDLSVVSLGRYRNKISYVIGARYPDESLPQIWIEKDTFRPIRYILTRGDLVDSDSEEVEYADYTSLGKNKWYPARILFYKNSRLTKMYVLEDFKVNPELSDKLFDMAHLRSLYQPMTVKEPAPSSPSQLDDVEKTIQDFSKTFE